MMKPASLRTLFAMALALAAAGSIHAQTADFDLAIAIPKAWTTGTHERAITYDKSNKHPLDFVYVLLTNKSGVVQHLWEEWNSWGFHNLNFEFTDATGKTWMVKRGLTSFAMNAPTWFPLERGETHVFAVKFPDDWQDLPKENREAETYVTIRAIYEIPPDPMTQKNGVWMMDTTTKDNGVWTGKAISNPVRVRLMDSDN